MLPYTYIPYSPTDPIQSCPQGHAHVFHYKQFVVSVSIDAPACVCVCVCWLCKCVSHIIKSTNTKTSTQTVKAMIDSVDIRFLAPAISHRIWLFVHWAPVNGTFWRRPRPFKRFQYPISPPPPPCKTPPENASYPHQIIPVCVWLNDELHCMCLSRYTETGIYCKFAEQV